MKFICDGDEFLTHFDKYHRGWCLEGSSVNASPFRYLMLWFDDPNLLEFLYLSKKPQ